MRVTSSHISTNKFHIKSYISYMYNKILFYNLYHQDTICCFFFYHESNIQNLRHHLQSFPDLKLRFSHLVARKKTSMKLTKGRHSIYNRQPVLNQTDLCNQWPCILQFSSRNKHHHRSFEKNGSRWLVFFTSINRKCGSEVHKPDKHVCLTSYCRGHTSCARSKTPRKAWKRAAILDIELIMQPTLRHIT